jgi:hypothetical protein
VSAGRRGDAQFRFGGGDDLTDVDSGRGLAENGPVVGDVDDREVGDDAVDAVFPGQRRQLEPPPVAQAVRGGSPGPGGTAGAPGADGTP